MEKDNTGSGAYPQTPPPQYTPPIYANINNSQPPNAEMQSLIQSAPVISDQPIYVVHIQQIVPQVGVAPTHITCPSCKHNILTRMEYESNSRTHLIALILCLIGGCLLACIPYCNKSCQSTNHYCPECGAYIGTYQG